MSGSFTVRRCLLSALRQPSSSGRILSAATSVGAPHTFPQQVSAPTGHWQHCRALHYDSRGKSTVATVTVAADTHKPEIQSALPGHHLTAKVIFNDNITADFKYIWLRDNCKCSVCRDPGTNQKTLDTPSLDINIRPKSVTINDVGSLKIVWNEADDHVSTFDPKWLFKYGQSFMHNTFELDTADKDGQPIRSEPELWDRTHIWKNLPELSYNEFMNTDSGLQMWLDMFHKYGVAILRGVPAEEGEVMNVVERFAYVKETQYGRTFDVINSPALGHLAYSDIALAYHTDMNYREKSPGMQLLHCLKANDPTATSEDIGGRSMFVDGFRAARWMEENEPTAFHVLNSTPARFSIKNSGMRYSAIWPIICTNSQGDLTEIHYNNRTMQPLQAPTHVVTPFYHAYKLFSDKLVEQSAGLEFNLVPGDLVAFNNRRVLHARSAFDSSKVDRKLEGCYVDIDEAFSKYDQLLLNREQQ